MNKRTCLNREYLPDSEAWVHLIPLGNFPGVVCDGKTEIPAIQRFERADLDLLAQRFQGKLLVDFEHRASLPDGDTTAAAWITKVALRDDGLWGQLEMSDLGQAAVDNKRYRHISPVVDVELATESTPPVAIPIRLAGAGFTNRPLLKALTPMFNRDPISGSQPQQAAQAGKDRMKELIALLGLPETADEAAVMEAVKAIQTERDAAKAKLAELETAALDAEAETFVAANKARIKDPVAVKAQYIQNRETCKALFGALAEPVLAPVAPVARTLNRAEARTPAAGALPTRAAQQQEVVAQVRNRDKCGYKQAFNAARRERPELFEEDKKAD